MKHRNILLVFPIILLLSASACSFSTPLSILRAVSNLLDSAATVVEAAPAAAPTPEAAPVLPPQIYQVTRTEESEDGSYSIEIIHPELNNAGNAGENFNYVVEQLMLAQLDYFKANLALINDAQGSAGPSSYHIDFNLYRQDSRFVSLLFIEDTYYAGAAHPGQTHSVLNYSLPESRFYELADLFYDGSPYIYLLSEIAYDELSYTYGKENIYAEGVSPIPDRFSLWNITPNGLLITFEEYQVTAYAAGSPQVLIPYKLLENYIDPAGPLGSYMQGEELSF